MPIRRIREYAELMRRGEDTEEARMALLEEHRDAVRSQLAEMERTSGSSSTRSTSTGKG